MATIGTMRKDEAKVFDGSAGYHQFHNEDGEAYGSFEVFWMDETPELDPDFDEDPMPAGWYWQAAFPGCLPDGEPNGPFATSHRALADAEDWA